jgi:hypothetical protein
MQQIPLRLVAPFMSLLVAVVPVAAQDRDTPRPASGQPATLGHHRKTTISPDGRRVAWVELFDGAGGSTSGTSRISRPMPALDGIRHAGPEWIDELHRPQPGQTWNDRFHGVLACQPTSTNPPCFPSRRRR